jgi:hypothetical protein
MISSAPIDSNDITDISDIDGLLIIDWWDETDSNIPWSAKVKSELDKLNFRTVIVSNYEIQPSLNDPCQFNTIEQYGWHDYQPKILSPLLKECRQRNSNQYIKENYASNGFVILDIDSLLLHFEKSFINVKNWLIVGGHWQQCVHYRPVGLQNLIKLPFNFFVTNWSCYTLDNNFLTKSDFMNDCFPWIEIGNDLYKLG